MRLCRKQRYYLVFEYLEKNLLEIIEDSPNGIDAGKIKNYVY